MYDFSYEHIIGFAMYLKVWNWTMQGGSCLSTHWLCKECVPEQQNSSCSGKTSASLIANEIWRVIYSVWSVFFSRSTNYDSSNTIWVITDLQYLVHTENKTISTNYINNKSNFWSLWLYSSPVTFNYFPFNP